MSAVKGLSWRIAIGCLNVRLLILMKSEIVVTKIQSFFIPLLESRKESNIFSPISARRHLLNRSLSTEIVFWLICSSDGTVLQLQWCQQCSLLQLLSWNWFDRLCSRSCSRGNILQRATFDRLLASETIVGVGFCSTRHNKNTSHWGVVFFLGFKRERIENYNYPLLWKREVLSLDGNILFHADWIALPWAHPLYDLYFWLQQALKHRSVKNNIEVIVSWDPNRFESKIRQNMVLISIA